MAAPTAASSTVLNDRTLVRQALFQAVANALLLLAGVSAWHAAGLLAHVQRPLIYATVLAIALRDWKDTLAQFWEEQLKTKSLPVALISPFLLLLRTFKDTASDLLGLFSEVFRRLYPERKAPSMSISEDYFSPVSTGMALNHLFAQAQRQYTNPTGLKASVKRKYCSPSAVCFKWLGRMALMVLAWETLSIQIVYSALGAVTLYFTLWQLSSRFVFRKPPVKEKRAAESNKPGTEATIKNGSYARIGRGIHVIDKKLREALLSKLHAMVVGFLLSVLLLGALSLVVFSTVQIARESHQAATTVHAAVKDSEFMEGSVFIKWFEESGLRGKLNHSLTMASEYADQQFHGYIRNNHLEDLWDTVRAEFGPYFGHGLATNDANGTVLAVVADEPSAFAIAIQDMHNKVLNFEVLGALQSAKQAGLIVLQCMDLTQDDLKAKAGQHASTLQAAWSVARQAANSLVATGFTFFGSFSTAFGRLLTGMFSASMGIIATMVHAMVFFTLLFYLLSAEKHPLSSIVSLLPIDASTRIELERAFEKAVQGVLLSSMKLVVFNSIFTYLLFHCFGIQYLYFLTVMSALSAILPLIPSWLVLLPAALQLGLLGNNIALVLLVVIHFLVLSHAHEAIYSEMGIHPFVTGLSIIGGMSVYKHPIEGAVMGPMLLTLLTVGGNLYSTYVLKDSNS